MTNSTHMHIDVDDDINVSEVLGTDVKTGDDNDGRDDRDSDIGDVDSGDADDNKDFDKRGGHA